jgi:transposase
MTEQEQARWTKLVGDFETSDLTQREFATQRGISFSNLRSWIFLFVGSDHAGENLAGLSSPIATCEVNGVNPVAYLADVLLRVQTHDASRIDELLRHRWKPSLEPS